MQVSDLVRFNRENYYNGAVQTEWFYDVEKVGNIAKSYVFHGPKYFGVSTKDIITGEHKLIDTASYAKVIADKIFSKCVDNSFLLTIAGYGTGKSHLAVTLGALFSGEEKLAGQVVENIRSADDSIANEIDSKIGKKNLIIALNGMKNFNLDAEILRSVKLALELNNVSDEFLKSLTKTYDVATYFVNENFENCISVFEEAAKKNGVSKSGNELKEYLIDNIVTDSKTIEIINSVFQRITGDVLHWEQGVSAGEVLLKVSEELCGDGKPFNKVLVLFDEFGRYIEYVAANPAIAGDASLQQIFEAIQSANNKILFVGFIQYELEAYLSHIDKTSNVIRYVGRYSASEKYYLSSNFETILANLLEKNANDSFDKIIGKALDRYDNFHSKMHSALTRWDGDKTTKSVWKNDKLYRKVILEGCYPLHPITVWLLSNSSSWMQQRSTIAFCAEMFENVRNDNIDGDWLPYIYPVDIIDSGIYGEMLNSEEKGLVKSQNCMLYNEICVKIGDKLTHEELQILKAILICKVAGFKFYDKEDAYTAFRYCTNLREEEIKPSVKNLEDRHGVISFDDQAKTFDLIAEANGFNEFKRVFARYRTGKTATIRDIDEEMLKELGFNVPVDTAFAPNNHISSGEWKFEKQLVDSSDIDESFIQNVLRSVDSAFDGESFRGALIYAYCGDDSESEIHRLSQLYNTYGLEKAPVIIVFLDDDEGEILRAITVKNTLQRFSIADNERFSKHIAAQKRSQNKKISQTFNSMVMERRRVSGDGLITYEGRLNSVCTQKFDEVYNQSVPFAFDGFENSKSAQARKTFATICVKIFDHTLMNIQSYQALTTSDKNRVQSCLSVGVKNSWQVFGDSCQLVLPQNDLIKKIYNEVDSAISDEGSFTVNRLFGKYLHAPYGMNVYSYTLFVIYFIQKHENKLICHLGNSKLTAETLNNSIIKDGKIKFSELQRVTIQKNLNADVDVVADLCNEILENADVYKCVELRNRLGVVIRGEGSSSQNQVLIGQANMRLDDGDRIRKRIEERKDKIKSYLDDAAAKLVIHRFVGIFEFVDEKHGIVEEGLPYVYPQSYIEFVSDAMARIRVFMGDAFNNTLCALRCSDITQIGSFQNTYAKVVKRLREQGYNKQADDTEARVNQIIEETKAKNQYNQALGECEKDVALLHQVSQFGYDECDVAINKLNGWKSFFEDADMPESVSRPFKNKIDEALQRVTNRKKEIVNMISECEENVHRAETLDDLLGNLSKIDELKNYQLPDEFKNRLEEIESQIKLIEDKVEKLPELIDELSAIISSIKCESLYDRVYLSSVEKMKDDLIRTEKQWIERVLLPIENDEEMDAQQCTMYIDKLRGIPGYVSYDTIQRAKNAEGLITAKLHSCKVQGVLSLFNSLSDEEKSEFLRIVNSK